jgi:hypothetical protein
LQEKLDKATNTERIMSKIEELQYELRIHMDTLTLNLVKCKRPAGNLLDDMDYLIESGTGRLKRLENGVLPYRTDESSPYKEATVEQTSFQDVLADW